MMERPRSGESNTRRGARRILRDIGLQCIILIATLCAAEGMLRLVDLRYLRIEAPANEAASIFRFDPELGWSPRPSTMSTLSRLRTITVQDNSLGLRDIEQDYSSKPTILFLGDSFF